MNASCWAVIWTGGFLAAEQRREFPTEERAIQWAQQAGVFSRAKIEQSQMTPHTPGPWRNDHGIEIAAGEKSICGMRFPFADDPEMAANARLISAAPELLEALEGLLSDRYLSDPINADRMAGARAAIQKATGGAQ